MLDILPSRRLVAGTAVALTAGSLMASILAPGTAGATPIASATYAAQTTADVAHLTTSVAGQTLTDVALGAATANAGTQPQSSSATSANLRAAVLGLATPVTALSQAAPPDHLKPTTGSAPPIAAAPLLTAALLAESAQARLAAAGSCLASGVPTSQAVTTTARIAAGVGLVPAISGGSSVIGDVLDLNAVSGTATTALVHAAGAGDTRAVQSRATATVSTLTLLNGTVSVSVVGTPTLTAQATGSTGTSSVSYNAPLVTVSVNGGPSTSLNAVGAVTIPVDLRVLGTGLLGSVQLSLGVITDKQNTGTAVSASATVISAHVGLDSYVAGIKTATLADVALDVAPLAVSASAPADGVQCSVMSGAPTITSPAGGSTVTTNRPPITGTGTTGDTITVTTGNGTVACGPVTVVNGHWGCTPTAGLPQGSNTVTATETDPSGPIASQPVTFTVNASTPAPPVITSPANGSVVNNATVAFTGTGIPADTVTVTESGTVLCTAVVDSAGSWHCSPTTPLSLGVHSVLATQQNPTNHVISGPSATVSFTTAIVRSHFTPLTPYRVLDTRAAIRVGPVTGPVGAGGSVRLSAEQLGLHNANVTAVALNVTVTQPVAGGFLTAYPSDQTQPGVSSSNYTAGQTRANLVIIPVAADGSVTIYTSASAQLVADVFGYFSSELRTETGGLFHPITPARLLDTRPGNVPLGPDTTRTIAVAGHGGVPAADVAAVVVNVTVSRPTSSGYVSAFPAGAPFHASTSNVNFARGDLASGRAIVPVGAGGGVSFYNRLGSTSLVVDVVGYLTTASASDTTGARFVGVDPMRVVDSRIGVGTTRAPLAQGETRTVRLTGASVPTAGTTAVVANLTAVAPTADGYLTQYQAGIAKPFVSDVNFIRGEVVPNLVVSAVNASGDSAVYNSFTPVTSFLEDITGYFTTSADLGAQ